jgi:hypothetical protein
MAAQAADPFVNSNSGSVVTGGHLKRRFRSMTLVANPLPGIRAENNGLPMGLHDRHRKHVNRKMSPFAPVVKSQ